MDPAVRHLLAFLAAVAVLLAACGDDLSGPQPCIDACTHLYDECDVALVAGGSAGVTRQGCVDACAAASDRGGFDCLAGIDCSGTLAERELSANRCLSGDACEAARLRVLDCYGSAAAGDFATRCLQDTVGIAACVECLSGRTCDAITGTCDEACGVSDGGG